VNPEFLRNIWLQFSPTRLFLAPLAIGSVLLLVWLVSGHSPSMLRAVADALFYLIVLFWGTRRAADLVAEEVAGGTWDSQRMSALGAWQMTWGKVIGGTSYVWYAGVLALAAGIAARRAASPLSDSGLWIDILHMLGTGLFGQAVAFVISLALLRKQAKRRRLGVTLSQLGGLLSSAYASGHLEYGGFFRHAAVVDWYLWLLPGDLFALATLGLFLAWSLFGAYRLMRAELQFRSIPWAWLAFALFLMVYADGLLYGAIQAADGALAAWLSAPFAIAVALTYIALFLEPKDVLRYRWLLAAIAAGEPKRALALLPQWLPGFVLAAVGGALLAGSGGLQQLAGLVRLAGPFMHRSTIELAAGVNVFPLAVALYLLRDVLFVLHQSFGPQRGRGDLTALICLLLVYFPLSGILLSLGRFELLPLLVPYPLADPLISISAPLAEAAVLAVLVGGRLRAAGELRRPAIA
jgi:hypothetical protein